MKYDKYQELVDYVTVVGPADDKKRSYKYKSFQIRYPFAACEILSLDNSNTIEFFFPDNSLEIEEKIVEEVEVEEEVEIEDDVEETQPSDEPPQSNITPEPPSEDATDKEHSPEQQNSAEDTKEERKIEKEST